MGFPGIRFDGQTVLVTGASSGIGRDTALAFAEAGANVVLAARHTDKLRKIANEVRSHGVGAIAATTDVTEVSQVRACFRKAVARFGGIDIVVNNAGVLVPSSVLDIRRADLQKMLDVNLFGALYVMQEAVHHMRQRGRGSIVNVASLAGRRGIPPLGAYCATKFGLVGLTEALRTELVGEDIHVSLVLPGVVETPMATRLQSGKDHEDFWPQSLNMPTSWVVAAIFAAARLRLAEVAVPPGAALIEKLAALAPGAADTLFGALGKAAQRAARRERR